MRKHPFSERFLYETVPPSTFHLPRNKSAPRFYCFSFTKKISVGKWSL